MPKITQSPGTVLTKLLEKHKMNYNRLAKAIGLSSAMVRLIARDENPVSASVAFRLARFFRTTNPEYWLKLQLNYELSVAEQDKKLAKALKEIPTVDEATFERKPKTPKAGKSTKKSKTAKRKKTTKPKKVAAKKVAAKKAGTKKFSKAATKKPTSAKSTPAAKEPQNSSPSADMTVNEPDI